MSKNEINASKFIKEYKPYYTQLETANRYIHENDDSNFDTTNLALVYKKLKKAMPANAPTKYNLDYYDFEFDAEDGSNQTRFKINNVNGLPALFKVSMYPDADASSDPFSDETIYEYPINKYKFTSKTIVNYPKRMKFKGFGYTIVGLITTPLMVFLFMRGGSFLSILSSIIALIVLVSCFVIGFFGFKFSKESVHKSKASSLDLINAINHIKGTLGNQLDKYEQQINYRHVAAKHYKKLSDGNHSWSKVKKEVQDDEPETIGSVLAREKVKYE